MDGRPIFWFWTRENYIQARIAIKKSLSIKKFLLLREHPKLQMDTPAFRILSSIFGEIDSSGKVGKIPLKLYLYLGFTRKL
ncbi:MAG TPA: hypothetical protein DCE56_09400 [Cyanobacteria bacterium UBA8553]|nr:hypothetical protein [Cyanobacteria bacterium UBA8553]